MTEADIQRARRNFRFSNALWGTLVAVIGWAVMGLEFYTLVISIVLFIVLAFVRAFPDEAQEYYQMPLRRRTQVIMRDLKRGTAPASIAHYLASKYNQTQLWAIALSTLVFALLAGLEHDLRFLIWAGVYSVLSWAITLFIMRQLDLFKETTHGDLAD